MADLSGFDASQVEPTGFDPLPSGMYRCVVAESEMRQAKSGTGEYLQVTLEVIDGEHSGRKLWERFCLEHPKDVVKQIARGQLSALCRATGVLTPTDSSDMHDIPIDVVVGRRTDSDGEVRNVVRRYKAVGQAADAPAPAPKPAAAAATADNTPPWKRSK